MPYRSAVKRFALVGHPVGHSASPAMMRAAFESLGVACSYEAIDVPDEAALAGVIGALRAGELEGLNVTLPHKQAALRMADSAGESAARAGAANVLVREAGGKIRAENTDAPAIVRVLDPKLKSRRWALVIGSGGAARAALLACERLGFQGIEITSRSWGTPEDAWERGAELPEVRAKVQLEPWMTEWGEPMRLAGRDADLVIQATSAGMKGADPADEVIERVPWELLSRGAVAFDVVYRPRVTPFLARALRSGLAVEGGLGMLVEQAALAIHLWLGVTPSVDVLWEAAERALEE